MPPYTSSIQVLDGANDITSIVSFDSSFQITACLTKEKGQFTFNIMAPKAPTLPTYMPVVGDTRVLPQALASTYDRLVAVLPGVLAGKSSPPETAA